MANHLSPIPSPHIKNPRSSGVPGETGGVSLDLHGMENRLWSFVQRLNERLHVLADALILKGIYIVTAVELYELSV